MRALRRVLVGSVAAALLLSAGSSASAKSCPVTKPNGKVPPGEGPGDSYYGNGRLWTGLPTDGVLIGRPSKPGTPAGVELHRDGSISTKFWWWGGRKASRRLKIWGKRRDRRSEPLRARIGRGYTGAPQFWPTRLTFPATGCWRVTGKAGKRAKLSFVIAVVAAKD